MKRFLSFLLLCIAAALLPLHAHADLLVRSVDSDSILRYDDHSGAFLGVFARIERGGSKMTIGPDGMIYAGSGRGSVSRFDRLTGASLGVFAAGGGLNGSTDLSFGPDGNLYVGSWGGTANHSKIVRFDGTTGAYLGDFIPEGYGGLYGVTDFAFGPQGDLYVASRVDGNVLRYDGAGVAKGVFASVGPTNGLQSLLFAPNGSLYALDDTLNEVRRFNGETGAFLGSFPTGEIGTDGVDMAIGPDGQLYISSGYIGNSVLRFDLLTGAPLGEFVSSRSGGLNFATGLLFTATVPEVETRVLFAFGLALVGCVARTSVKAKRQKRPSP